MNQCRVVVSKFGAHEPKLGVFYLTLARSTPQLLECLVKTVEWRDIRRMTS
jgi:hypothetical protein